MFKFNIALFIMITFLYSLPHPPSATLQWNPNIFGNWTKVKKVHPHKYKIKSKYSLWVNKSKAKTIIFSRKQDDINDKSIILS